MERAAAVELVPSGRDRELSMLLKAHEEARERAGARFAFVSGSQGIGKTHLFEICRRALVERGVRVFEGRISRSSSRAYSLFSDIVPDLVNYLTELGVPARTVADLARRTAPLSGREASSGNIAEDRRLDLFDAVAEVFALAGRAVPAFLLADADAADRASLELLRYVAASCLAPGARAAGLFVVSLREESSAPPLLAELLARTPAARIPLQGLDLEGIRAFLSRRDIAERLLDATGGIPLALEDAVVSGRPVDFFSRRVASLPSSERDALLALAVFGEPAKLGEIARLVATMQGAEPADLSARLDRLVRDRIVEVKVLGGAPRYSLARDSEREKLLQGTSAEQLAVLHAACGELLEADGGDPEVVARHFLAADPSGKGSAAAMKAAEALLARYAFDEAAEFFRIALEHAPRSAHGAIHERLASILRAGQDYVSALRHVGLARRDRDEAGRRALRAEAARLCMQMGRLATAERLGRRVLGPVTTPEAGDAAGVRAFVDCAEVLFLRGKYDESSELCEKGLSAFDAAAVQIELRNTLGKIQLTRAAYADAAITFQQNAEQALQTGLQREHARALINQGVVAHRRGDRRAAITHYRAGLQASGADRALAALALSNLGSLYADSAEFDAAVEHLSRALGSFTRARRDKEVAHCAINLGHLHLFLGDLERARELSEHGRAVAAEVGDPYLHALGRLLCGELHEASGAVADAAQEMAAARVELERLGSPRYAAEASLALARLHLARGERSHCAAELARPAIDEVARSSTSIAVARDLIAGELALVAGDLPEATRRLSAAKDLLLESPDLEGPYRVYHLLSRLRAAAGDAHGAAQDAARAARLLDELVNRVPVAHRTAFLRLPRRAAILATTEREITPSVMKRALSLDPAPASHGIVGASQALQKVFKVLEPVARSPATVLIRGESGTGKELLADAIHRNSPRRDMPFVKVNCAAMVEELLMSELFGHEKGAFTGAIRERKGRFELAEGGTIFLDEIGDISPKAQVALLRVLQEREFERVGGTRTIRVDVRVVCATNRDLEGMITRGEFRQDLYYRLKGVMLELPPLRERHEDLAGLSEHFLSKLARERGEEKKSLSPEALAVLKAYPWPGNIRELENVMSSASIFASGQVITPDAFEHVGELASLAASLASAERAASSQADEDEFEGDELDDGDDESPVSLSSGPVAAMASLDGEIDYFELARAKGLSLKDLRQQVEVHCIRRALGEAKGNISEAARLLKMKRSRLSQIVNSDPLLRSAAKGD